MAVHVPGVSEADIEELLSTVLVNFEPRMIRMEHTNISLFGILTFLALLSLIFSLIVTTHVILERREKMGKKKCLYKVFKKTNSAESAESEEETHFIRD